jgi:hypothetical protein
MTVLRMWFVLRWKMYDGNCWEVVYWSDSESQAIAERDRLQEKWERVIIALGSC